MKWPYYQKDVNQINLNHNTLKLSFTNIRGLGSNFIEQSLLTFLLYMRQTRLTQLILAISLRGYLPLIRKDSATHMHDLAVYVKEGLPFARDISLESLFLLMFST